MGTLCFQLGPGYVLEHDDRAHRMWLPGSDQRTPNHKAPYRLFPCNIGDQINLSEEIRQITTRRVWDMISPVALIALFMVAVCVYLYTHTRFGRHIKATGTNRSAAKKIGINTTHIMMSSFIISGLMAGSAGIAHVYINSSALASKTGVGDEFTAITACVLGGVSLFGGVGSFFPGVMIGVLFLKLIENALNVVGTDPYLFSVIKGVIISYFFIGKS